MFKLDVNHQNGLHSRGEYREWNLDENPFTRSIKGLSILRKKREGKDAQKRDLRCKSCEKWTNGFLSWQNNLKSKIRDFREQNSFRVKGRVSMNERLTSNSQQKFIRLFLFQSYPKNCPSKDKSLIIVSQMKKLDSRMKNCSGLSLLLLVKSSLTDSQLWFQTLFSFSFLESDSRDKQLCWKKVLLFQGEERKV